MELTFINLNESDVQSLADHLRKIQHPHRCNVMGIDEHDSSGRITNQNVRLEISPSKPGVYIPLNVVHKYVEWAAKNLVELAEEHNAP